MPFRCVVPPSLTRVAHRLQDLDSAVLRMDRFKRDMDDAFSTVRYTHLKTLTQLVAKRNALKTQDKSAQQRRDQWFPQTVLQYNHITDRDVQLRVARFLTSSTTEQERMMDEFKWPSRAVQPLRSAFKSDVRRLHSPGPWLIVSTARVQKGGQQCDQWALCGGSATQDTKAVRGCVRVHAVFTRVVILIVPVNSLGDLHISDSATTATGAVLLVPYSTSYIIYRTHR